MIGLFIFLFCRFGRIDSSRSFWSSYYRLWDKLFAKYVHIHSNILLGIQTCKQREIPNKQFPRNRSSSDMIYLCIIKGNSQQRQAKNIRKKNKETKIPSTLKRAVNPLPQGQNATILNDPPLPSQTSSLNPTTLWSLPNLSNRTLSPPKQTQFPSTFPLLPFLRYVCIIGGLTYSLLVNDKYIPP